MRTDFFNTVGNAGPGFAMQVVVFSLLALLTGCGAKDEPPHPQPANEKSASVNVPSQPPAAHWKGDLEPDSSETKPGLDFTGLRGVLAGKWESKNDKNHRLQFTGKSIEFNHWYTTHVGKYETKGDMLTVTDRAGAITVYGLEFLSDGEIALRPEKSKSGSEFNDLAGQWRRVSLPPGGDPAILGTGPVADAQRQVKRIEQKQAKLEGVLGTTQADRDDLVARLRAVGVTAPSDLKGNVRGQRLAENLAKIDAEIDGLERQLAVTDSELLKAKSIVRRMEREQAGLSEADMRKLAEQLKEVEERTDGAAPNPPTPLDVEAAVEKVLKATPRPAPSKKSN
jgi:hypothetical protein